MGKEGEEEEEEEEDEVAENRLVWFLLRANRGQDRGGSDKDKGENGGGGEGERECVLGGV